MPIEPHEDESQSEFMRRCMRELADADTKRPHEQMVAICLSKWRGSKSSSKSDDDE